MKKISVIVPVYNVEKYLARCIDSILEQNYESFEIILVDDGSKDSSGEICDKYANADGRIKVIHKENAGVSEARNTGIDAATGDYIMFIDSDDEILQGFFENAAASIGDNEWYVSGLNALRTERGEIVSYKYSSKEKLVLLVNELFCECDNKFDSVLIKGPCAKLYVSQIIKANNIRFDSALSYGEDTMFNLAYCRCIKKIYVDNEIYYMYHKENEGTLSSKYIPNLYEQITMVQDEWRKTLENLDVDENTKIKFENNYFNAMVYVIGQAYKYKRTSKEKHEIIKKVIKNEHIHKNRTYGHNFSSKLIRVLITKRITCLVRLAFWFKVKE